MTTSGSPGSWRPRELGGIQPGEGLRLRAPPARATLRHSVGNPRRPGQSFVHVPADRHEEIARSIAPLLGGGPAHPDHPRKSGVLHFQAGLSGDE